jgi:hypothetical protein
MLDKQGNSNPDERIDLLGEFCLAFPVVEVKDSTADRECLGAEWFEYLLEQSKLPFRIRIRESDKQGGWPEVSQGQGGVLSLGDR